MWGNLQPEAIGHTQTRLQPESGAGRTCTVCSLVNWEMLTPKHGSYTPSGQCVELPRGASLGKPLEIPGGFGVAPVIGVSGVATTSNVGGIAEIPRAFGGIRTGNLAISTTAQLPQRCRTPSRLPLVCITVWGSPSPNSHR